LQILNDHFQIWLTSEHAVKLHSVTCEGGVQNEKKEPEKIQWPDSHTFGRLSVKRVDCDKMEERSVQIFIPYEG